MVVNWHFNAVVGLGKKVMLSTAINLKFLNLWKSVI